MTHKKHENEDLINNIEAEAKAFLDQKHSNCYRDNFFPEMINRLNYKVGAEIGVDKAGFSQHVLSKTKIEKYYCIDSWQDDFGSDCKPGYFDKDGNVRFNEAKEILKPYILNPDLPYLDYVAGVRAIMIRMTSIQAANTMTDSTLDFCYIDGDHSLEGIYEDLKSWIPKVKIGGIIAGHDYKDGPRSGINDYFGHQLDYKIKTVVDNYTLRHGFKLNVIGGRILNWWFVKNKEA